MNISSMILSEVRYLRPLTVEFLVYGNG